MNERIVCRSVGRSELEYWLIFGLLLLCSAVGADGNLLLHCSVLVVFKSDTQRQEERQRKRQRERERERRVSVFAAKS